MWISPSQSVKLLDQRFPTTGPRWLLGHGMNPPLSTPSIHQGQRLLLPVVTCRVKAGGRGSPTGRRQFALLLPCWSTAQKRLGTTVLDPLPSWGFKMSFRQRKGKTKRKPINKFQISLKSNGQNHFKISVSSLNNRRFF